MAGVYRIIPRDPEEPDKPQGVDKPVKQSKPKAAPKPSKVKAEPKKKAEPKPPKVKAEPPPPRAPRRDTICTKVSGVTFKNDHDGSSRQEIIRRYCKPGMQLDLDTEPNNPRDPNAIGLWIWTRHFVLFKIRRKIGYVGSHLAPDILEFAANGRLFKSRITEVTGGGVDRNYGVNFEIEVER